MSSKKMKVLCREVKYVVYKAGVERLMPAVSGKVNFRGIKQKEKFKYYR